MSGATGFLGRAACIAFTNAGYTVRALVRRPSSGVHLQSVARGGVFIAKLPGEVDLNAFAGRVDAVIHCAYSTHAGSQLSTEAINLRGTRQLRDLSMARGVTRFVFISSMAAHQGARSIYGCTKWILEMEMTSAADTILRPGTVIGRGGIFVRTLGLIRRLPIVPLLYADACLQFIDVGDVVQALLTIVGEQISGTLQLAHPETITIRTLCEGIMALDGSRKPLLPLPGGLALLGVSLAEKLGLFLPITSDNLLGLKHLQYSDPRADLARLKLQPLSFEESLARLQSSDS